ncbi:ABC-type methionine transport system ATPase subunit [Caballeronia udeis]|jgi:hypothetical protein|uniref:ABC-type methionine transport system ATPase subunit n=1 Tax=Caballeronia udeis TaxID=1232866 RepID=A0ABW8MGX5_9BURK
MLSPHELSTLLLIQHSPSQVEPQCSDVASLEHEHLVRIEATTNGRAMPRLTARGSELLQQLHRFCTRQFADYH